MRMIDADALIVAIYNEWDGVCVWDASGAETADKFGRLVEAQPTIEEQKTGFWYALEKGDKGYSAGDFKCSVCGEPNHTWIPKPNFCQNCGADMRGEQND